MDRGLSSAGLVAATALTRPHEGFSRVAKLTEQAGRVRFKPSGLMRKIGLSPFQCELLRMLSEAGEENLSCIRATLRGTEDADFSRQVA
jgi:hypothetical protein